MLVWNRLRTMVECQGMQCAVACEEIRLSYTELADRAQGLALYWAAEGMRPGDRVALHLRNGIDLAVCYYACFAGGFVAVPVNNRLTPEEVGYVLEHSGAKGYVSQADLRIATGVRNLGIGFGTEGVLPEVEPDRPAMILYTSGTTARPKGVVHTQRTLAGNASFLEDWGLTAGDHTLLFTPMVHASGGIMMLVAPLWIGGTVTVVPLFDAGSVLDTWERSGATFFMALPTLARALVAEQRLRPRAITTGRLAICGGDTVPVPLQEEYAAVFGHPMVEGFGMTEGLPMLANRPGRNRPGSMGRPLADLELRVADGEMQVRGAGIAVGYWGEAPFPGGWLATGDLVEVDADGFVWFRGRKKEIIIRGGSNISPQEVEETLYLHPAVGEAGVIGEPDSYWGEVVVAFVALRPGFAVGASELAAFCREHLAAYKCPERVELLPVLPKGATGKVQRRALKELKPA